MLLFFKVWPNYVKVKSVQCPHLPVIHKPVLSGAAPSPDLTFVKLSYTVGGTLHVIALVGSKGRHGLRSYLVRLKKYSLPTCAHVYR